MMSSKLGDIFFEQHKDDPRWSFSQPSIDSLLYQINNGSCYLYSEPSDLLSHSNERVNELLYGEAVEILERHLHWTKVRHLKDGYCGWLEDSTLIVRKDSPSHVVNVSHSNGYQEPHIKSAVKHCLPYGSLVYVAPSDMSNQSSGDSKVHSKTHQQCTFIYAHNIDCWLVATELRAIEKVIVKNQISDIIDTARLFIGHPYVFGGRSFRGLDCSALVQLAFSCVNITFPRDSDQQQVFAQHNGVLIKNLSSVEAGDLIFWPGHVAIAINQKEIIHATATPMTTLIEPLASMNARVHKNHAREIRAIIRYSL